MGKNKRFFLYVNMFMSFRRYVSFMLATIKCSQHQSLTALILNMATMGDVDCGDVEVSVDIGELLSAIAQIELLDEPGADCEHVLFQFS